MTSNVAAMRVRVACLATVLFALSTAAGAEAATECRMLTSCDARTSPWIAVPSGRAIERGEASPASFAFPCPTGRYAAGFDFEPSNVDEVLLDVPYGAWGGFAPVFRLLNDDARPGSARISIGCVPRPASSRTAIPERGATLRMVERRVRADRQLTVRQRCDAGERATAAGGAILFEMRAAPTQRLLRGFTLEVRSGAGGVRGTVVTEAHVGDDERVVLHLYAVCV